MDDLALLRLELETLWITDADGRVICSRTPDRRPAPLLVVAAGTSGICWAVSTAVPAEVEREIADALSTTSPNMVVGWTPDSADPLLENLARVGPVAEPEGGPSFVVPSDLHPTGAIETRPGADRERDRLVERMPEADRAALSEPWSVALADGQVAAVCETARSAPASVEAGVWTYERYRRRGYAAAVVATWATTVRDRTAFYSTSWENVASQGVARRLGLRPLGQWWQVSAMS
jgi:hypothetical protein